MDKALYLGMSSAKHNMLGQSVRSNNLANASTDGFRADFEQARSMGVYFGEGHPTRAFATGNGLPVMGSSGPIVLPNFTKVEVGRDGIISVVAQGSPPDAITQVDSIKLINPEFTELKKGKDGLLYSENEQFADINVRVVSGFIEASNVNPVEELTRILTLSRQYEMSIKVMQTAQENSESSARLLQFNS